MVQRRTGAVLLVGVGIALLARPVVSPVRPAPAPRAPAGAAPAVPAVLVGASSCAGAACHGRGGPRGSRFSEYDTWAAYDPHARAFDSLRGRAAADMARALRLKPPTEEPLCLGCHVHPEVGRAVRGPGFHRQDGVGCESCHGAAGGWVDRHYLPGWRDRNPASNGGPGLADTRTVAGRAAVCVRCHVGTPGADVNHDLIAAGHPPLRFEFAAYHHNLPRHWSAARDRPPDQPRGGPDFEARAWAVGQVVSARAALRLLAARAEGQAGRPWPEFAEFDCVACHHDLNDASGRRRRAFGRKRVGSPPWGDWYHGLALPVVAAAGGPAAAEVRGAYRRLEEAMGPAGGLTPEPAGGRSRRAIAREAVRAAALLEQWPTRVEERFSRPGAVRALRAIIRGGAGRDTDPSWDRAAQTSLALEALRAAGGP